MNRRQAAIKAAVERWRAATPSVDYPPGKGNAARTNSHQRRAGSRKTKQLARRRR